LKSKSILDLHLRNGILILSNLREDTKLVKRLRELREQFNLTQKELGAALGISSRRVSAYETDQEPGIDMLIAISNFFGVTVDYLIGNSPDMQKQSDGLSLSLLQFGKRIRDYRIEKGIKQADFAKQLEITPSYLNLVESGTKIPSFDLVVHILNELEMSADAALCDSLISATPIKASFLQSEVADLDGYKRVVALETIKVVVKALKELA
jgi:transcriptional regulator with XRE-family HTH domain